MTGVAQKKGDSGQRAPMNAWCGRICTLTGVSELNVNFMVLGSCIFISIATVRTLVAIREHLLV
jgi:hypothetical protein